MRRPPDNVPTHSITMNHPIPSTLLLAAAMLAASCGRHEACAQTTSESPMTEIRITVGGRTFAADIEDSETGRAFVGLLPLTLDMSELNGNEKYYYLDAPLPTRPQHYDDIEPGDLMLYGTSCVVLFYGPAGGYSYTRLGRLRQTDGLAEAVGRGSVSVTFEAAAAGLGEVAAPRTAARLHATDGTALRHEPAAGAFIKDGHKIVKQR